MYSPVLPAEEARANQLSKLESLPSELLQLIVAYLDTPALKNAALASQILHRSATNILWQSVCLTDQYGSLHLDEDTGDVISRGDSVCDQHDDTPIIQKLFILATNPDIASKVHVVTHRCHLPTPNIFSELPYMYFDAENISQDARLHTLLRLAMQNLVNVHTLRIVYGHWRLTNALVAGLLDERRPHCVPLRRLWLESCCFSKDAPYFLLPKQPTSLESIRIRRLGHEMFEPVQRQQLGFLEYSLARGGQLFQIHNGTGGFVNTTVHHSEEGMPERWLRFSVEELRERGGFFDSAMWRNLPEIEEYIDTIPDEAVDLRVPSDPTSPMQWLIECSTSTLTSLNLDWILWGRKQSQHHSSSSDFLHNLTKLHFPHLRAFQVRNAVLPLTRLPDDIYLLEDTFLGFLEAHPKIQCIAWPMDRFYGHKKPSIDVQTRSQKLVAHLAMMLTDLRLDVEYTGSGEPFTDESSTEEEMHNRFRRRRFIEEFIPHMRKVEQIKLEGGIPRDEKREVLRALHWCQLKKVVMIGVSFPAGNTWGADGVQLRALDPGQSVSDGLYGLEDEDLHGILASYRKGYTVPSDFTFEPNYGWPAQAPLLQTIALHHANTVEEVKISGYNGSPILSHLAPITNPLLAGLRCYDNLKQLVVSFWLLTWFEDSYRDAEIIQSWIDTRSPASTALTVVTPPTSPSTDPPVDPAQFPNFNHPRVVPRPQDFNRWAVLLKTQYSSSALAYRVARDIGPFLSPVAKARPGGVRVRASFCLGTREARRSASDIFDLDLRIGRGDQVLEFVGPREEGEKGRWRMKLDNRRWF